MPSIKPRMRTNLPDESALRRRLPGAGSRKPKIWDAATPELQKELKKREYKVKYVPRFPRRKINRHYKYYELKKNLDPSLLLSGDIILTKRGKSLVSWGIRKILNSNYSHVTAFHGWEKINGKMVPMIKDFTSYGSRVRPLRNLRGIGKNLLVLRWKNATPAQMGAFLHNLDILAGNYDWLKMLGYGLKYCFRMGERKLKKMDVQRRFTCVEFIVNAANPPEGMIKKFGLKRVVPPLDVNPSVSPDFQTPETFENAGKKGATIEVIDSEVWRRRPMKEWDSGKVKILKAQQR